MNSKLLAGLVLGILLLPSVGYAQLTGFTPLVGIPGITDNGLTFNNYINALYALSISIAALLAVIKIIIAGMKWMLSDVVTSKGEAISDIKGAIFGLVVVISAVLILTVINPQLTTTQIFLQPVTDAPTAPGRTTPGAIPISGTGYRALDLRTATPEAIAAFSAECQAAGSIYRVEGAGTAVCYAPLPSNITSFINTEFGTLANIAAIRSRFQTTHYPRMITDSTLMDLITRQNSDATQVLLAVTLTSQNDWLDSANRSAISATCGDFQRVSPDGQRVTTVFRTAGTTSYAACVLVPDPGYSAPL